MMLALQMSTNDPAFWVLVVVAASFAIIAIMMIVLVLIVLRLTGTVKRLEERTEPLFERLNTLTAEAQQIAAQGREVGEQVKELSGHLSTASLHVAETTALLKDEVRELKQLVGYTTETARDKVEMFSRAIDETHLQVTTTTAFIHNKVVEPAREIAAILAGVRRGLEVLLAPAPRPVNQSYGEEEMFIG